jgi:perosamine synthetase
MQVAFAKPHFPGGEAAALSAVIESGWVAQGPRVAEFERAFADRVGAPYAVATSSCTTALHLTLYALGVGPGDEVVIPSLSFIATANAVWQCGAEPVFADVDPTTGNLSPEAAARAITPRTKAIMPVHQVGLPADMDAFFALAEQHSLLIVEDAACAIGATYKGRQIGSLGAPACFSLHPRKVITSGEGGMITVHDEALADRLRKLRQHAMDLSDLARHGAAEVLFETYPEHGFNARMTDLQAALGLTQLAALDDILAERRAIADRYSAALAGLPHLELPVDPPYAQRTWQSYPVRVRPTSPLDRIELMQHLLNDGIATRRGVMAIHHEAPYSAPVLLPHTERAAQDTLMLPLFCGLTAPEQEYVVSRLSAHTLAQAA